MNSAVTAIHHGGSQGAQINSQSAVQLALIASVGDIQSLCKLTNIRVSHLNDTGLCAGGSNGVSTGS